MTQESDIIRRCSIPGGDLANEYMLCGELIDELKMGTMPQKDQLVELHTSISRMTINYDCIYKQVLSEVTPNPLESEQAAWILLSEKVHSTLQTFKAALDSQGQSKNQLLKILRAVMTIMDNWVKIINSFKCVEQDPGPDYVTRARRELRELIEELSIE